MSAFTDAAFRVESEQVQYTPSEIIAEYEYRTSLVQGQVVRPVTEKYTFKTQRQVPRVGLMLVGWSGNNGTTVTAGILANKHKMTWRTKEGVHTANYFGSITQASTIKIGTDASGQDVFIPFKNILPMVEPNDLVLGGWDIQRCSLGEAMEQAQVLDYDLQRQLRPMMDEMTPLPGVYFPDFIAANQEERANNVLTGTKQEQMETVRSHIRNFKAANHLDKVIILWTANTERFCDVREGLNDTADNLLASIRKGEDEVSPSSLYCVASILEGCSYVNDSPQNTLVPGVVELAQRHNVFIGGDDFKSGQTKMKSVLVDFLVSAGIKPRSIVSYNHLGNNDGKNLSAPQQFRSKEISKSNVVDDMVASNRILYAEGEHPDHCVVIKYVPFVGDSKRAMDEYTSEIFLNGRNTIVMHNTCEDSLLASPLIYDLVILTELCERIRIVKGDGKAAAAGGAEEKFDVVLSLLSYLLKAPAVPKGTPVVNALFAQRQCIVNIFRACVGLPPDNHMLLEHKLSSSIHDREKVSGSAHTGAAGVGAGNA